MRLGDSGAVATMYVATGITRACSSGWMSSRNALPASSTCRAETSPSSVRSFAAAPGSRAVTCECSYSRAPAADAAAASPRAYLSGCRCPDLASSTPLW